VDSSIAASFGNARLKGVAVFNTLKLGLGGGRFIGFTCRLDHFQRCVAELDDIKRGGEFHRLEDAVNGAELQRLQSSIRFDVPFYITINTYLSKKTII
jgi:hypothetical protein